MTHPTWELPLETGALILTPCPGTKGVSLTESLAELKAQGVTTIVTALNQAEMIEAGVSELASEAQAQGIVWLHAPIEDDKAPAEDFAQNWQQVTPKVEAALAQGDKVALHCMGGSGRTGLLAAHVLLAKGWDLDTIITKVQALREGAFRKPVQIEYIQGVAKQFA